MRTRFLVAVCSLVLLVGFVGVMPTASAGCSLQRTCAIITGSSMCSTLTGVCSGTWTGHHSGPLPGTGELRINGVLVGVCTYPGATVSCVTTGSFTWRCGQAPPTVTAKSTTLVTNDVATDSTTGASC